MSYGFYTKNTQAGDVFGDFTVIEPPHRGKAKCRCKCGNVRTPQVSDLHKGRRKSCGCESFHAIGDIVNGRRLVARSTGADPCVTVECLKCGHRAKVRAGYNEKAACRNCEAFDPKLVANGIVYALLCPFTGDVMYVGATRWDLDKRMRDHFKARLHPRKMHKPVYVWIRELEAQGTRAGITTLETVADGTLLHREVFWIKKLRAEGVRLLNIDHNMKPQPEGSCLNGKS